mgnify:FL=1
MNKETSIERLRQVRSRTLVDIDRLKEQLLAEIEPASATDDDSADVAADIYERGKIISLIQSLEAKIKALDHAIELAQEGRYGICEMCHEPIPEERLELMPETTLCVRCAAKVEQGIRRHRLRFEEAEEPSEHLLDEEEEEEEEELDDFEDEE